MNFFQEMIGVVDPNVSERRKKEAQKKRQHEANLSTTRVPFGPTVKFEEDLTPDQSIMEVIVDMEITNDQLRSSAELKKVLNEVVSSISLFHCWGKQSVKVRLSAFVKLLVSQLCMPPIMSLYGVGATMFAPRKDSLEEEDLVGRAKRILVEAFTLFKLAEECVLDSGDDSCLDKRRVNLFILLMELKTSPFLSHALTVRHFGGSALEALSCHILCVTATTHCIQESIKLVISRITNILSGETTTSTIADCTPELEGIILDYFVWLRENYTQLIKLCRKEEILTSVDSSTRAWLRGESYNSPVEIISVYNQKYRHKLTHMPIPLQPYRQRDIEQARKDLVRETVIMNNVVYRGGVPTTNSSGSSSSSGREMESQKSGQEVCSIVKSELRKVLAFLFEIDIFQGVDVGASDNNDLTDQESNNSNGPNNNSSGSDMKALKLAAHRTPKSSVRKNADYSPSSQQPYQPNSVDNEEIITNDVNITKELSEAQNQAQQQRRSRSNQHQQQQLPTATETEVASFWEFELLDALYSYTILAASRTFAAGDAFLILNDLYGGDGLVFCPTNEQRSRPTTPGSTTKVGTPTHSAQSRNSSAPAAPTAAVEKSSIDANIAILASGVKVTLRERYGLYVSAEMDTCTDRASLKPLMRFECTTTTLLILNQSVDASVSLSAEAAATEKREACGRLFQTIISNPEHMCHRAITIEPFL